MKHDFKTYGILLGIFILSVGSSWLVPADIILKSVMASPGIVAMLSALFQLIRDQASYEREQEAQQRQFQFALGAASHMANTAFDMHVEFCENYMDEVHDITHLLFREGDTEKVLTNANKLYSLREKYAVWLTDGIDQSLEKFELALRTLGANAYFVKTTTGHSRYKDQRSIRIDNNFDLINEILGFDKDSDINEDYAIISMKKKLRSILSVEELTGLRIHVLKEASNVLARNS